MIFKNSEKLICAFCKLSHRVYLKKEVSFFDAVILLFITGLLAFAIWGGPDLRSMLIFMSLAFGFQVFLRMRYRESVKCPHCGFDPILYKQNPKMAADRVNSFVENRKDNPEFMLKPKPKIKPIYLSPQQMKAYNESKREELAPSEPDDKLQGDVPPSLDSPPAPPAF
ncbi:MAG: hypothetical protein AAF203_05680 [Pseudomonadota bacterium]